MSQATLYNQATSLKSRQQWYPTKIIIHLYKHLLSHDTIMTYIVCEHVGGTLLTLCYSMCHFCVFPVFSFDPTTLLTTTRWFETQIRNSDEGTSKRTSFSAPVVVPSSFSNSVCMELSSCCRIISWNCAIPPFGAPLHRPWEHKYWSLRFISQSSYILPPH